jgi:23S rRNA (uracil1939-C5)-methyltransferase
MDQPKSTKKGTIHEFNIHSTAFKGKGVGKIDELAVFVAGTAPGDKVKAMITKRRKSYREAKLIEILEPSELRITPKCQHAEVCGGCSWQHLSYQDQLKFKTQQVTDHMRRIAKIESPVLPAIGSENEFHYRNKMEYSFGNKRWLSNEEIHAEDYVSDEGMFGGLHAPGRFDKILPLKACYLQIPVSFEILDWTRDYAKKVGWTAYDASNHEGYLRNLGIRSSYHTSDIMVHLLTKDDKPKEVKAFTEALISQFQTITTVVNNILPTRSPVATGELETVYFGPGYITDNIGPFAFKIHPNAFFQTNTAQAEKLYEVARNFADIKDGDIVYDLYCGVGTLSLFVAKQAKFVLGIELNPVAIKNAHFNAESNNISQIDFIEGDMKEAFNLEMVAKYGAPDVLITDPPRAGMHPDVVKNLLALKVPTIVYVSCDSSTMARDLFALKELYTIDVVQPVDMFPQTYHIETVAKLSLKTDA